eukprot:g420.t1
MTVRPTAFFKSLLGQVKGVKGGAPYVMFGDGTEVRCKPISEEDRAPPSPARRLVRVASSLEDLASFMADCFWDPAKKNQILPVARWLLDRSSWELLLFPACSDVGSSTSGVGHPVRAETMQNDEGRIVDLYLPRKCSATNRLIPAKEHGAVQLNVAQDLQQQLAEELTKRKHAQYSLIEKAQELCDVQEKLARSQQRVTELEREAKKEDRRYLGASPASPRRPSTTSSPAGQPSSSACAPALLRSPGSPCASPGSPFTSYLPIPPSLRPSPDAPDGSLTSPCLCPAVSQSLRARSNLSWHSLEIPEMEKAELPNTCNSGYHTPVRYATIHGDYPRILSARVTDPFALLLPAAQIDEQGQYSGEFYTFALAGFIRQRGESDACLNRLLHEKGLLTFSK